MTGDSSDPSAPLGKVTHFALPKMVLFLGVSNPAPCCFSAQRWFFQKNRAYKTLTSLKQKGKV